MFQIKLICRKIFTYLQIYEWRINKDLSKGRKYTQWKLFCNLVLPVSIKDLYTNLQKFCTMYKMGKRPVFPTGFIYNIDKNESTDIVVPLHWMYIIMMAYRHIYNSLTTIFTI